MKIFQKSSQQLPTPVQLPADTEVAVIQNCNLRSFQTMHQQLSQLIFLDLKQNALSSVKQLEQLCHSLQVLKAAYNQIDDYRCRFGNLLYLDLSNNKICELVLNESLVYVNVANNRIKQLDMSKLLNLKEADVSINDITDL